MASNSDDIPLEVGPGKTRPKRASAGGVDRQPIALHAIDRAAIPLEDPNIDPRRAKSVGQAEPTGPSADDHDFQVRQGITSVRREFNRVTRFTVASALNRRSAPDATSEPPRDSPDSGRWRPPHAARLRRPADSTFVPQPGPAAVGRRRRRSRPATARSGTRWADDGSAQAGLSRPRDGGIPKEGRDDYEYSGSIAVLTFEPSFSPAAAANAAAVIFSPPSARTLNTSRRPPCTAICRL